MKKIFVYTYDWHKKPHLIFLFSPAQALISPPALNAKVNFSTKKQ